MEEVRLLVQEEGREARNLVAFHVAVDNPGGRVPRKPPPRAGLPLPRYPLPRLPARLRSASAGRDKRSELRARYWALLFGDLQRAVGELYNTVEAHENPNECQEVILVLENYTRDFRSLCEWFRLKWEYESTPPPQRPQSLAWEIRKTDFVRPESRRTHSVRSSPSVSGKNSPCLSGHNTPSGKSSPNLTGKASPGSGKISPRPSGHVTSPKSSTEFFSSKITSKIATKPEPKVGKETRLSDIKEKDAKEVTEEATNIETKVTAKEIKAVDAAEEKAPSKPTAEVEKAKECLNLVPMQVILKSPIRTSDSKLMNGEVSNQAKATIDKLVAMESEFLAKNLTESTAKNDNLLNKSLEHEKSYKTQEVAIEASVAGESVDEDTVAAESPTQSEDNFADISNGSSKCEDKVLEDNKNKITVLKVTKAKSTDVTLKANGTSEVDEQESVKYKESMTKISNDSIENPIAEKIAIKDAVKDIKPTEEMKNDVIKDKTKSEPSINDKRPKTQRIRKFPKGLKKLENKFILKKEDTRVTESAKKETEPIKKEEIKKLETKPIFQLKSSSRHEYTHLTVEDIDIKKDEIKKLETKPIFDVKVPTRPAFNQATIDLNKKEDVKKVDTKPTTDCKPAARPAYSQAAAKPKLVTTKAEVKTQTKVLARSKTVVEIRPPTSRPANRNQKSKCSYPFNLTTGRSSLFDGGANKATNKKPVTKPLSAGDRSQSKTDAKRPPRPMSLKLNEKGDKEEKDNLTDTNKDLDEYSSSETLITQIDITRIESSESLKTIVPENENDVANSVEVLNVDGTKNDNEGWLTVKSKRLSRESKKSKSHWANRFNQPSATTSLPTLNMLESPKSESNTIITSQLDRAKSEQPQMEPKAVKVVAEAVTEKIKDTSMIREKIKDTSMIRQKSDVTGLKTKSSRNKALKKDKKIKDSGEKLTKNRLHSSLESLTNGLARSQESTTEAFDFDKWRAEFKTTFKYLEEEDQNHDDTEILKTADPSEMSEIAEMTSQIEENERKISLALDFQTEDDQKKLCREEDLLNRQIMELQQVSDIDMDTETDETETDAEVLCEDSALESCQSSDTLSSLSARLEDQYEGALAGMSWAERVDTLGVLEELVARDPGRAQQLHAKLSQGIKRRGSLQDALRRLQAKQARAEQQRINFHTERAKRIHQLLARVEEVKVAKTQLIDEKRIRMERRLQKAAENRFLHLKLIVRKAHDEEEKLREIAFIKQLQAENRRHEFLEQCRSHTTRLREMRRERLNKLEQKSAREAAVGARKKALDEARKLHVEGLLEKRRERDARVEGRNERRKQERDDAAREKVGGLDERRERAARVEGRNERRKQERDDAAREKVGGLDERRERDARVEGRNERRKQERDDAAREKVGGLDEKRERDARVEGRNERRKQERDDAAREKVGGLDERRERDARVEGRNERRKQERDDAAREKAEGIKSRLSAIAAAAELEADALRSRIRDKQDASQQRLESHLQAIREKATTGPRQATTSESQEAEKKEEADKLEQEKKEKEKQRNIRKKARKVKQKLLLGTESVEDLMSTFPMSSRSIKLHKLAVQLCNLTKSFTGGDAATNELKKEDTENNNAEDKTTAKKKYKKKIRVRQSSASESVASSTPEAGARAHVAVDVAPLERALGEILRIVSAQENQRAVMTVDKTLYTRVLTVKTCGQILACAAETEDIASQLTTKSLNTCVRIILTTVSQCASVGFIWLQYTPALVHCVTLLSKQVMEKDMLNDPLEDEFTNNLTIAISLALNLVVQEPRLTKGNGKQAETLARVHNLVSYICLSGIVSHPERCGESRKTLQTLLNVIGDILLPVYENIGPERLQAQQNLRAALNRDIFHMRNELCLLFAEGAELAQNDVFVNAARIVHALRALGEVDYKIVQEGFGEDGWPLEFRAAISRLLNQHAPSDKEAPRKDPLRPGVIRLDADVSNTFVMDLIELIGYVTVNNPPLRNTICESWSVIKTLCNLPANWLVSRPHVHKLLPTLLVLAQHAPTMSIITGEISLQTLTEYLESDAAQEVKLIQLLKQELRAKIKKGAKAKDDAQTETENITDSHIKANAGIQTDARIKTDADIVTEVAKTTGDHTN